MSRNSTFSSITSPSSSSSRSSSIRVLCRIRNLAILFISVHIIFVSFMLIRVHHYELNVEDSISHVDRMMEEFMFGGSGTKKDVSGSTAKSYKETVEETNDGGEKSEMESRVRTKEEATKQMESQPSYWVQSQKHLKQELLELQNLQKSNGEKKGVSILHHYLGKDVPVYAEKQEEKENWNDLVKQKKEEVKIKEEAMELEKKKKNVNGEQLDNMMLDLLQQQNQQEVSKENIENDNLNTPQKKDDVRVMISEQQPKRPMPVGEQERLLKRLLQQESDQDPTQNSQQSKERPVLTAYMEPINQTQWSYLPLPIRTSSLTTQPHLKSISYPHLSSCTSLPSQFPIDTYPEDDPFLPWIHDVIPSSDGSYINFVAQNKRRCQSGKYFAELKKHLQPQLSLFQPVSVKRVKIDYATQTIQDAAGNNQEGNESRYRLASYKEADGDAMETRFICRFKDFQNPNSPYLETLSEYFFSYDYNSWRKRYPSSFTYEGFDNHIMWTSQLLFRCPVPTNLQQKVASGETVQNDYANMFVDLIPIRTPPRYGPTDEYLPPRYGRPNSFDTSVEWGDMHLLPRVEDSGRWENIPICKPSLMQYDIDQSIPSLPAATTVDDSKSLPKPKKHELIACTWASSSFETRGGFNQNNDGQRRLREWIEFHLLSGFDHIYVYDNSGAFSNATSLKEVTELFSKEEVTHVAWPAKICNNNKGEGDNKGERSSQYAAESSCRLRFGVHAKWIANMDIDEYLVPLGKFESMKELLRSFEENKEENEEEVKILTFSSMQAKPRLDLLQAPEKTEDKCMGQRRCFDPVIPDDTTVLQTYNCDIEKPPRTKTKSAEKQIYQSDHVLLHFVHYSSITVKSNMGPQETKDAGMNYIRRYKERNNHNVDEVNEAIMIHSRAVAKQTTTNWSNACKLPQPSTCKLGTPFPPGIAPILNVRNVDENGDVYRDAQGYTCNCYVHEKIEKYWVPRLEKAMKERDGKL